ncbi:MAG: DUF433 domain-containing protein [bacterium]
MKEAAMPKTKVRTKSSTRKARLRKRVELGKYIVSDPEVYRGELTFKGTRILVKNVLTFLEMGGKMDELLKDHPSLSDEAVQEAVELASKALVTPFEPGHDRKLWLPA